MATDDQQAACLTAGLCDARINNTVGGLSLQDCPRGRQHLAARLTTGPAVEATSVRTGGF